MTVRTTALWFFLVLLSGPSVSGQPAPDAARVWLGPFGLTPTIEFANVGRDTNVFQQSKNEAPEGDFTGELTARADLLLPLDSVRVTDRGSVGLSYFLQYANERSVNVDNWVRVDLLTFSRLRPYVSHSFLNTRDRDSLGWEIDTRPRRTEQVVTAGSDVRLTGKLSLEVAAHLWRIDFEDGASYREVPLSRALDRDASGVTLTVRHAVTPLTTLALAAEKLRTGFEFSPDRNSEIFRLMPGVEFNRFAPLTGKAYVGFRRITYPGSGSQFSGLNVAVDLSYTLFAATRFEMHAGRDVEHSFRSINPHYLQTGIGGSVTRELLHPWTITATVGKYGLNYRWQTLGREGLAVDASAASSPDTETVWSYGTRLGYRLGERSRVSFGFEYYHRRSGVARDREYERARLGTSLVYGF
jgi:hypothetical protein